jgi:sec-independent protein translocase protein TatA
MPNIGPLELIIVLVIVLLIFGPKRLPGLGRQLGSGMREFKDSITNKHDDDDADDAAPPALPAATTAAAPEPVEQPDKPTSVGPG